MIPTGEMAPFASTHFDSVPDEARAAPAATANCSGGGTTTAGCSTTMPIVIANCARRQMTLLSGCGAAEQDCSSTTASSCRRRTRPSALASFSSRRDCQTHRITLHSRIRSFARVRLIAPVSNTRWLDLFAIAPASSINCAEVGARARFDRSNAVRVATRCSPTHTASCEDARRQRKGAQQSARERRDKRPGSGAPAHEGVIGSGNSFEGRAKQVRREDHDNLIALLFLAGKSQRSRSSGPRRSSQDFAPSSPPSTPR